MSDESSEYESSEYGGGSGGTGEYEGGESEGSEGGDWIAGSEIQAEGTDLQTFSGTIDVDTSGLPEPTDADHEDGDYVA